MDEIQKLFAGQDSIQRCRPQVIGKPLEAQYQITAKRLTFWRGLVIPKGKAFPCTICGHTDRWQEESTAYVCDHGPVEHFECIRNIDSVAKVLVC